MTLVLKLTTMFTGFHVHVVLNMAKFDIRTVGLFKLEWQGDCLIGLCSKTYII